MSYSGSPGTNAIDTVRFLIGDTNPAREFFSDGEILYALTRKSNVAKAAAAMLARQMVGKLTLTFTGYKLDDYTDPSGANMAKAYLDLAKRLESELIAGVPAGGIYAGGISVSDKEAVASNTDRVEPAFRRGMDDNDTT